ncbi:MAG: aldehyde ferredoxin oxidoreductase family protein [Candidatus Geothermincolia bacterium]
MFGNMGKVLEYDLGTAEKTEIQLDQTIYQQYIGGAGLAAKIIYDHGDLDAQPLDPGALLVFAAGPCAGIGYSGSSRFSVCGRSPLTGIWGQASCGGDWGPELKMCGYDALVLKGKAAAPSYILLGDDSAELVDASDLWGKDTYEVDDLLKEKHGKQSKVLAIGPAAENGVLYGCIMNDKGHTAGRTGMGTVMASKNIKAIVAHGSKKLELKDPEKVKEMRREHHANVDENLLCQALGPMGTSANLEAKMFEGDVPCKNWSSGWFEEGAQLGGVYWLDDPRTGRDTCRGCIVRCKPVVTINEGPYAIGEAPGPEYETIGTFGTNILNPNFNSICKANDMCNRLGFDTITGGSSIAWAIECFEQGIFKPEDYDGIKLSWGDIDAVIAFLPKLAAGEGKLAKLLAQGSVKAAAEIGQGTEAWLSDSKGLEAPMHDPRCNWGDGIAYAFSVRGACHVSNMMMWLEWGAAEKPEIGLDKNYQGMSAQWKGEAAAKTSFLGCIYNSACWCEFSGIPLGIQQWAEIFNAVADYGYDLDSLMKAGARVYHLQRALGFIWGATAADDKLGQRIMTPLSDAMMSNDSVPDMETMTAEFVEWAGLRPEDHKPTRETLEAHDLGYLADRMGV